MCGVPWKCRWQSIRGSEVLVADRVFVPGAQMSGLSRILPSEVTGPRLLKKRSCRCRCLRRRRCKSVVDRWRIRNSRTAWAGVSGGHDHHDACGTLRFHSLLERVRRATFRGRAVQELTVTSGPCPGRPVRDCLRLGRARKNSCIPDISLACRCPGPYSGNPCTGLRRHPIWLPAPSSPIAVPSVAAVKIVIARLR